MFTHQNTFCDTLESSISGYDAECDRMEKWS
jgi:hypothetical protein